MNGLFKRFWTSPKQIGSLIPSSSWLVDKMLKDADLMGSVLELGAGTGVITKEIFTHLPKEEYLDIVEIDPILVQELHRQFPHASIHLADAEHFLCNSSARYRTIISGIPFAVMEKNKRSNLFQLIHAHLEMDGKFVMFQYSQTTLQELKQLFGSHSITVKFVAMNIPPAFVFICEKTDNLL